MTDGSPIPSLTATAAEGHSLLDLLTKDRPLRLEWSGTAFSPYTHELMLPEPGRIPDRLGYDIGPDDVRQLDTDYHAPAGAPGLGAEARHGFRPYQTVSARVPRDLPLPARRTGWVSTGDVAAVRVGAPGRPLLQVDYDLDADLLERVRPGTLPIGLVHRQARVVDVAGVESAVSADGGRTWRAVPVTAEGGGRFTASVPPLAGHGWVSLRVAARDVDGNAVEQTVERAYRLA